MKTKEIESLAKEVFTSALASQEVQIKHLRDRLIRLVSAPIGSGCLPTPGHHDADVLEQLYFNTRAWEGIKELEAFVFGALTEESQRVTPDAAHLALRLQTYRASILRNGCQAGADGRKYDAQVALNLARILDELL